MRASRSISILISSISVLIIFAAVSAAQDPESRDQVELRRRIVKEVRLAGVKSFPQSQIRKLLYTKPNHWYNFFNKRELSRSNVNLDEGIIKRFYQRRGYPFVGVRSVIERAPQNRAVVSFIIDEGRKTYLSSIGLEGGLEEINRRFGRTLDNFEIGEPLNAEEVASGGFRLRDLYSNNAYPYAIVRSSSSFNHDSSWVDIKYAVKESIYTVYDETRIIDDTYTRPSVINRELTVKRGRRYSQKEVIETEQRLYSLGLFKLINLRRNDSEAVTSGDTCHVGFSLNLRERKSYFLNFGLGLGRQEDFPVVLRSSALWGNRNLFGTGRKAIFAVRPQFQITPKSGLEVFRLSDLGRDVRLTFIRATMEANYITPWMFWWRIPVTARVLYEPYTLNAEPQYRYDRIAGEVIFTREINRFTSTRVTANTEYINVRNIPSEQQETFRREVGDIQIRRRLLLYGERDTRDNILVPQKGAYSFAGVEYVGGILGGDFNYVKTQFMWSRFNRFKGQNLLATRIWLGFLDDRMVEGRSAPLDRFMIGGSNTIRGFRENDLGPKLLIGGELSPAGGRYMMIGNIEIRRPLFWRFGGATFLDAGNTYSRFEDITPLSIRFTTGLGLHFLTPIGPIRFDYAVRLQKEFDLGAGLYHLAILYAF